PRRVKDLGAVGIPGHARVAMDRDKGVSCRLVRGTGPGGELERLVFEAGVEDRAAPGLKRLADRPGVVERDVGLADVADHGAGIRPAVAGIDADHHVSLLVAGVRRNSPRRTPRPSTR